MAGVWDDDYTIPWAVKLMQGNFSIEEHKALHDRNCISVDLTGPGLLVIEPEIVGEPIRRSARPANEDQCILARIDESCLRNELPLRIGSRPLSNCVDCLTCKPRLITDCRHQCYLDIGCMEPLRSHVREFPALTVARTMTVSNVDPSVTFPIVIL